jgi:hypothetical protein
MAIINMVIPTKIWPEVRELFWLFDAAKAFAGDNRNRKKEANKLPKTLNIFFIAASLVYIRSKIKYLPV